MQEQRQQNLRGPPLVVWFLSESEPQSSITKFGIHVDQIEQKSFEVRRDGGDSRTVPRTAESAEPPQSCGTRIRKPESRSKSKNASMKHRKVQIKSENYRQIVGQPGGHPLRESARTRARQNELNQHNMNKKNRS